MKNSPNFQKQLDSLIEANRRDGVKPSLMLHVCCAVCVSSVLEQLYGNFDIVICYYNPNITEEAEYDYRFSELRRYVAQREMTEVRFADVSYDPARFFDLVRGYEDIPEGGARCSLCFFERLDYTARLAEEYGCDYFATTLTVSPLKNAPRINAIGENISKKRGVPYLPTDFKKKNGYKRSIELSKEYDLYRQNFCGCVFSKSAAEKTV